MPYSASFSLSFLAALLLAGLLALLAVHVWRAWRGPGDPRALAIFLFLVAANYGLDATATLLSLAGLSAGALWWLRLAPVLADPPVLLLFGLSLLRPPRRAWLLLALAPVLPVLFLAMPPPSATLGAWDLRFLHVGLLTACYAGAFAAALLAHGRAASAPRREQAALLVVLLGLVVVPRLPLVLVDVGLVPGARLGNPALMAPVLAALPLLLGLAILLALRVHRDRREALRPFVLLGGLCACVAGIWLLSLAPPLRQVAAAWVYPSRWFLFLALAVWAAPPVGVLPLAPAALQRVRLALGVSLGGACAATAGGIVAATGADPLPSLLLGAGLLGLGLGARWSLRRALPGSADATALRREGVLRAHLEAGSTPERVEEVCRQLGITPPEAARAAALARAAGETPAPGFPVQGHLFLGRYRPVRVLAWGRDGAVHLAWDEATRRRVVLKEVRSSAARPLEEARRLLSVSHPRVVRVEAVERVEGGAVLVLEHVEGVTLREHLAEGPLPPEEARRVISDVLEGLHALHAASLVHRDLKPENVMLRPSGEAVLLDLGSAAPALCLPTLPALGHPGTLAYASPEQRAGERLDGRSDVYAAGVLAWETLSGLRPPGGRVPAEWRPAVLRALAARPEERWPDAAAFREALVRVEVRAST